MFAGLNGLGLWQSVPLTPISLSNSYLMRSIGSLEVVGAIYGSRRLRPYVFTKDDAISSEDQQLRHLIALEETKHNMYILRKDTEEKSFHLNTPPVAAPTYCPLVTTISNQMTDYLLQQLLEKVEREATLAKETNERNFLLATIAFVFLVAGQFLVLLNTTQTKHSIADMKLVLGEGLYKSINSDFQRLHKLLKSTILEVCEQLQTDIARFRMEFTQVKDVFGAFAFKCEDQFKYFAHITGANQRTNQQVIDQRLEEIGDDMENLVQIVPQILQEMQFMNDAVRNATGGSNGHAISPDTAD
ncbi:hypothetical protein PENARI_c001G07658 [Penicillium arizonense]|uniref:Uncharacterized protein n=1 Tax=Penicillium arizonense TaxID=1835702 RepID=A0A1F5LYZ4_PENAI|nr:hypothetical protein PENARI_c001G07658 [Penicillium arizonense]OGE58239.1 hypothetical protein PENARI_c001G07658 [Penicillium arizonense]